MHLGLREFISSGEETLHTPMKVHCYSIRSRPDPLSLSSSLSLLSSSSSFSSSFKMDDVIGTESGFHVGEALPTMKGVEKEVTATRERMSEGLISVIAKVEEEYPPTMPLLAQTVNMAAHMPWKLHRHYGDGKLRIEGERVKHHEYFEVCRDNGRLILNLVPLDYVVNLAYLQDGTDLSDKEEEEEDAMN
ncbi:hypothetical protein Nepgr_033452 [Nepenthes gracilis]|uniref:FAF domain-containing protein n=1 Tax=Nepenthes gracilis TaxID=150966 RepID=A0AAD3TKN0_NEPGR|nr:hypothetical protein Nepgr_033452 [Nepenthes gracilis]